jgi:ABC-type multidrug transport system fused ATPase/permease subunit
VLITCASAYLIVRHGKDAANFVSVLTALALGASELRPMTNLSNQIAEAAAAADRMQEVLNMSVEPVGVDDRAHLPILPRHGKTVSFENVSYRYPGQVDAALQDVSLSIDHGQTVALVGPNGSGKTTLMSLLPRLIEPEAGRVLIDGVDIATVNLRALRQQLAMVTQQNVLFEGTIAENIAYGRRYEPMDRIVAAARDAFADDFIRELPEGYDTRLGEGGTGLSGGQSQRLCIARAILRDPAILILDEATSQIDADSEAKINQALRHISRDRTVFVIAHRLSTVVSADMIVVMAEGGIAEKGTHAELLEASSIYRTLNQTQLVTSNG